jgi:hypothetical protein
LAAGVFTTFAAGGFFAATVFAGDFVTDLAMWISPSLPFRREAFSRASNLRPGS